LFDVPEKASRPLLKLRVMEINAQLEDIGWGKY
jgi:hypothetical protein